MRNRLHLLLSLSFCLLFSACQKKIHLVKSDPRYYTIDQEGTQQSSNNLDQLLAPYKKQFDLTMNDVIGTAAITLKKNKPESTLGNWMCDAIWEKAKATSAVKVDFALQNYGGIRIPELAKGDITRSKIYELMPFDNMLVIVALNYEQLQMMLEKIAASGGVPVSRGLRMSIGAYGKPVDVSLNGRPLNNFTTYHVALPDYIANGGDRSDYLVDLKRYDTGVFIRDLLIEAVEESTTPIKAKLDGRISLNQ